MGREPTGRLGLVDRKALVRRADATLARLNTRLPSTNTPVGVLSGGQRQAVAIGRALAQGGRVIIMDEPTAALGVRESAQVLELIQGLRSQDLAVAVISHNLQHVFAVADRIQVMRGGRSVGVRLRQEATGDEIVRMIRGVEVQEDEGDWDTDALTQVLGALTHRYGERGFLYVREMHRKTPALSQGAINGDEQDAARAKGAPVLFMFDQPAEVPWKARFWYPTVVFPTDMPAFLFNRTP